MKTSALRVGLLCLAMFALVACGKKQAPPAPTPQVGVITAQPENAPLTKDLVGRLSAFRSADVRARVAGVLLKRTYVEGSEVKKGQLLFQIDPDPLKAALNNAVGQLAQTQATYANDQVTLKRSRALAPKGYISKSDLDTALANERTAKAAVQAAQANVQTARINLGYADVTSPIDGRASEQQVTEGALVGSGTDTLLTTVNQIDPLYVNFSMGVSDLEQMRQSQGSGDVSLIGKGKSSVKVTTPDGRAYPLPGSVDFSGATVDPSTGAVNLRALIPNPHFVLLPGMYVTLTATLGEQHNIFLIPQAAVQRDSAGAYVYVVKNGKVERVNVTTSDLSGSDWVVTQGLKAGDPVIVSGVQKVKDGQPAKTTPWQPPTPASGGTAPVPASGSTAAAPASPALGK